jgi:hypothetical protein
MIIMEEGVDLLGLPDHVGVYRMECSAEKLVREHIATDPSPLSFYDCTRHIGEPQRYLGRYLMHDAGLSSVPTHGQRKACACAAKGI